MKPETVGVALTFADGTLGLMQFVCVEYQGDVPIRAVAPTPENVQREIDKASKSFDAEKVPVRSWRLIFEGEVVPADRTFRDAWRDESRKVVVDMPAAREIHREHLREARAPKLAALDIEAIRALEGGLDVQAIYARKQELRDVTKDPRIVSASTPEELNAVWPSILEGK